MEELEEELVSDHFFPVEELVSDHFFPAKYEKDPGRIGVMEELVSDHFFPAKYEKDPKGQA